MPARAAPGWPRADRHTEPAVRSLGCAESRPRVADASGSASERIDGAPHAPRSVPSRLSGAELPDARISGPDVVRPAAATLGGALGDRDVSGAASIQGTTLYPRGGASRSSVVRSTGGTDARR